MLRTWVIAARKLSPNISARRCKKCRAFVGIKKDKDITDLWA